MGLKCTLRPSGPLPSQPPSSPGLSGPSVLGVGLLRSDGKAKFNSTASQQLSEEPVCLFEGEGGAVEYGGSSDSLLDPFWCTANPPPPPPVHRDLLFSSSSSYKNLLTRVGLKEVRWIITHFKCYISNVTAFPEKWLVAQLWTCEGLNLFSDLLAKHHCLVVGYFV